MVVVKAKFDDAKGIPPSGLCVGIHRAGAIHKKMIRKYGDGLAVWSLRPELDFLPFAREGLGERGIRATNDIDSIKANDDLLIFGVRGAPPQVRKRAREIGLEVLADATCPFVIQQEEAAEELLREGYNLVLLSSRTHHGIPRLTGIAHEVGREICVIENENEVDDIRLSRNQPVGVIVQTTFWMESYKRIMARILERFANVRVRNMACVDSLHRLPAVEKMAKEVDALVIVGWTEGMTNRMLEVARSFNPRVYKIEKVEELQLEWVQDVSTVGVIGANETPDWMVSDVAERIQAMAGHSK
jgi:4-hydroxy-3-methylbut-2-enyl diphosphate reductase